MEKREILSTKEALELLYYTIEVPEDSEQLRRQRDRRGSQRLRERASPLRALAIVWNLAGSMAATRAAASKAIEVIAKPSPTFLTTLAVTFSPAGGWPALPSANESAIAQQPACVAASSSSGFVPAEEGMLQLTNQSHKLSDLVRDLLLRGTEILLEADSDKEREDQVCDSIVVFFLLPGR